MSYLHKLTKIANTLDTKGLVVLASSLDEVIRRIAADSSSLVQQYNSAVDRLNAEKAKGQSTLELQKAQDEVTRLYQQIKSVDSMTLPLKPKTHVPRDTPEKESIHSKYISKGQKRLRSPNMTSVIRVFNHKMNSLGKPEAMVTGRSWNELDSKVRKYLGLQAKHDYTNWKSMLNAVEGAHLVDQSVAKSAPADESERAQRMVERSIKENRPDLVPSMPGNMRETPALVKSQLATMAKNLAKLPREQAKRMYELTMKDSFNEAQRLGYKGEARDFQNEFRKYYKKAKDLLRSQPRPVKFIKKRPGDLPGRLPIDIDPRIGRTDAEKEMA